MIPEESIDPVAAIDVPDLEHISLEPQKGLLGQVFPPHDHMSYSAHGHDRADTVRVGAAV